MRLLIVFMSVLVMLLTVGGTVMACDCVTRSPSESFREADVVFEGHVIRSVPTSSGTSYRFRVGRLLKGEPARELTLVGGFSNCDATFESYTHYRVYARYFEGSLYSSSCFGNEVLGFVRVTRTSWETKMLRLLPPLAVGLLATIIWLLIRRRA